MAQTGNITLKGSFYYKVWILLLASVVVCIPFQIMHTLVTSTTDENLFTNPVSQVVVETPFAVDSGRILKPGDYVIRIQDKSVKTHQDALALLPKGDTPISIAVADAISFNGKQETVSSAALRESLTSIPSAAMITQVQPEGASDRAGLKRGDLIISINGQSFSTIEEADSFMRLIQPGETAVYRVLRRLQPIDCNLQLADFGIPFTLIINTIGGSLFLFAGLFLGFTASRIKPARRLAQAFLLLAGLAFLLRINLSGFNTDTRGYVMLVLFSFGIFGLTAFIHARWYFPSERNYLTSKKWVLLTPWVLAVTSVLAIAFLPGFSSEAISSYVVRWASVISIFFIVLFPGTVRFFYRKHKTRRDRTVGSNIRKLDWLLISFSFASFFFPLFGWYFPFIGFIAIALFFSIPIVYGHTILAHRLFGVQVKFDKNTQYAFFYVFTVLMVTTLGGFWFWFLANMEMNLPHIYLTESAIELVEGNQAETQSVFLERMVLIFMALMGLWVLRWTFKRIRTFLKRRFHRRGYDYQRAAQALTEALFNRFNIKSLSMALAGKISELMETKSAGVLIFNGQDLVIGERGLALSLDPATAVPELKQFLKTFHGTFSVDYLNGDLKKKLTRADINYICPIRSQNEPLGCLLIGPKRADICPNEEDFNFLKAAAGQSAIAIENALLYNKLASQERMKHELEIARKVQLSSLPQETPDLARFDISADSIPALEVGGDYFDYLFVQDHRIQLILADVSGKGTSAAFYMSKIQGIFRALAFNNLSPRDILLKANPIICKSMDKNNFVTALGLELDSGSCIATFARAGHLGLYHFNADTLQTKMHLPGGIALGVNEGKIFEETLKDQTLSFKTGDVFVLISDGLSEAMNCDREPFGEDSIAEVITRLNRGTAGEIKAGILDDVQDFTGTAPQHDDQTLVVVKIVD